MEQTQRYRHYVIIVLSLTILTLTRFAFGQEPQQVLTISYRFDPIDVPGILNDINNERQVVATQLLGNSQDRDPAGVLVNIEKKTSTPISCGSEFGEEAWSINNNGAVAGGCYDLPSGRGFIRDRKGHLTFLQFPDSTHTEAFGLNDRNQVVGQYVLPPQPQPESGFFRFHGFLWENGEFTTIDVPVDHSVTVPSAINNRRQIVGHYFTFDPDTNEASVAHGFFYDNGDFTTIDFPANDSTQLLDINKDGVILGQSGGSINHATSFGPPVPFLFYDDTFFVIDMPEPSTPDAVVSNMIVSGLTDRLEFVGSYIETIGTFPDDHSTLVKFIATPTEGKKKIKGVSLVSSR